MASNNHQTNPDATASGRSSNKTDIGWKYCSIVIEGDTNVVRCNFCDKVMKGGITKAKEHLTRTTGNFSSCPLCPKEVVEKLKAAMKAKKKKENVAIRQVVQDIANSDEEEEGFKELEAQSQTASSVAKKKAPVTGPIDLYSKRSESAIAKNRKEKLKQTSIKDACNKELTAKVHQYIARFWYQARLSFNMIKLDNFHDMVSAIGQFGPHLRPPSYHEIRVPLLTKEVEYTNDLMKGHKEQW